MNILIVGSGGREHAITSILLSSPLTKKIIVAPGNPGIEEIAECRNIPIDDLNSLTKLAKEIKADLVFIGPELPLVLGLRNKLDTLGIKTFGPTFEAAKLEGSKIFSRDFCKKYKIPQPDYFECINLDSAKKAINFFNGFCVIKADGLASGKGVIVCNDKKEAVDAAKSILIDKIFSKAGERILVEERIEGVEASVFAISNGKNFVLIGTAQDHKRAFDNDEGPNTGGMGAISPAPSLNEQTLTKVIQTIIKPTIQGMLKENTPYEGILYAGIMITNKGPKVIEFNCRLGDPETQVILPRFKIDFLKLILLLMNNKLPKEDLDLLSEEIAITVVLASNGYPGNFEKGLILPNLKKYKNYKKIKIFHSGTKIDNKKIVSNGGRVLSVTSLGMDVKECRDRVYQVLNSIKWKHGFFRRDIGKI